MADAPGADFGAGPSEPPSHPEAYQGHAEEKPYGSSSSSSSSAAVPPHKPAYSEISQWLRYVIENKRQRRRLSHINSPDDEPSDLQRLTRLFSTHSGSDKVLMLAGYAMMTGAAALERLNAPGYVPKSENDADPLPTPPASSPPAFPGAKSLESRLRNFSNLISDVRIFSRLWGIFGILEWGAQTFDNPPRDQHLRMIAYTQVVANIFYQILENLAYLAQHKILKFSVDTQKKLWAWSCRFWAVHVALDFGRLMRIRQLRMRPGQKVVTAAEEKEWWRQITCNLCWAPLTVHWSMLDGGYLNASTTGVLGTIAGILSFRHTWKQTAERE